MTLTWKWTIEAETSADRADKMILSALQERRGEISPSSADGTRPVELDTLSRNRLHNLIKDAQVLVDGKAIKTATPLHAGQTVELHLPPATPTEVQAEDRPLEILFEDEYLAVINKPPRIAVHPTTDKLDETLVNALLFHMKDLSGIGGKLRPGIVHRLDKNTSGALVITKTDLAHQKLSEDFAKHTIERRYWALCYSSPKDHREVRVESVIGRNPSDRKKMAMNVPDGRRAVSYFKKVENYGHLNQPPFASWIEARLETGRTHQVRVHATGSNFSLLGDPVYGVPSLQQPKWKALPAEVREAVTAMPGQALHARVLGFTHPITGKPLRFEAEPPPEFRVLLETLQKFRTK